MSLSAALSSCVNSQVFYFIPDNMNWTEAQTYCREHYTDLATANDQMDYDELVKTVPKGFTELIWIGLYRTSGTAPWVWSDQSKSVFRLWGNGQPNNYGGKQFCAGTSLTVQWQDLECPIKYASVCYSGVFLYFTFQKHYSCLPNSPISQYKPSLRNVLAYIYQKLIGMVDLKMKPLSICIHPRLIPNLYDFLLF